MSELNDLIESVCAWAEREPNEDRRERIYACAEGIEALQAGDETKFDKAIATLDRPLPEPPK